MSELQKWADVQPENAVILDFLDWCDRQKLELAGWNPSGTRLLPIVESRTELLNRYFEINAIKLENERRHILTRSKP